MTFFCRFAKGLGAQTIVAIFGPLAAAAGAWGIAGDGIERRHNALIFLTLKIGIGARIGVCIYTNILKC
jgi:hypothetical protein